MAIQKCVSETYKETSLWPWTLGMATWISTEQNRHIFIYLFIFIQTQQLLFGLSWLKSTQVNLEDSCWLLLFDLKPLLCLILSEKSATIRQTQANELSQRNHLSSRNYFNFITKKMSLKSTVINSLIYHYPIHVDFGPLMLFITISLSDVGQSI